MEQARLVTCLTIKHFSENPFNSHLRVPLFSRLFKKITYTD